MSNSFDLQSLNPEQLKPVLHTEGAVLVTAGAGTGKTRLLTHRVAHLVSDKGVPPYNILAITFTNKAAGEMLSRLQGMTDCRGMWVMTFHALCARLLRFHAERVGYGSNFTIYTEAERERVVKKILADKGLEADKYLKPDYRSPWKFQEV